MAQRMIAIDVSRRAARIVVIEATFRRARLVDVKSLACEPGWSPADTWSHLRAQLPEGQESVVVGADAKWASTRLVHFPFGDLKKAQTAIAFELEGQIPYPMDDVATAHFVTGRTPQSVHMLAAITPRAPLTQLLAQLAAAQIEPRAIVLPAAALSEYLSGYPEGRTGVASLGAGESHLAVGGPSLQFARSMRAGGDDVDRAIALRLGVDLEAARQLKETQADVTPGAALLTPAAQALQAATLEGLVPLVTNLLTTLKALPPPVIPRRLVITGGLSRMRGLVPYLQGRLGVAVEVLDIRAATAWLPGGPAAVGPEFAVALAMAVAQFRRGRDVPLNFRRGAFSYQGDIQLYRGQLTRMAVGTAAVLLLGLFTSVVRYSTLSREEKQIDAGIAAATRKIVGREIVDPVQALATLRRAPQEGGSSIPTFSAAELWEMLSHTISQEIDVTFDELDLRVEGLAGQPERLTAHGEAASFEAVTQIVETVRRDACVQEAEPSKQRRTANNARVEFSLTAKVACPPGVQPGTQSRTPGAAPSPQAGG